MWLLEGNKVPDHNTISRFTNERLEPVLDDLFNQSICKLNEMKELNCQITNDAPEIQKLVETTTNYIERQEKYDLYICHNNKNIILIDFFEKYTMYKYQKRECLF